MPVYSCIYILTFLGGQGRGWGTGEGEQSSGRKGGARSDLGGMHLVSREGQHSENFAIFIIQGWEKQRGEEGQAHNRGERGEGRGERGEGGRGHSSSASSACAQPCDQISKADAS